MSLITIGLPQNVDLAVPPIKPGKPSGLTIKQIMSGYSKYVPTWARAVNVEYRSGPNGPSVSLIAEGGTIYTQGDPRWPVMLMRGNSAKITVAPTDDELKSARWAFSAGPLLLRDGNATDISAEIRACGFSGLAEGAKVERAGVGIRADGSLVHIADTAMTLKGLQDALWAQGCRDALNLDGGGSVCVLDGTGKVLLGQAVRQVCCALVFRKLLEGEAPQIEAPTSTLPKVDLVTDPAHKLTANFTLGEFACKCGCGAVSISPKFGELVARLQMLREKVGRPVTVTSGYRCAKHDAKVGTSSNPGAGPHTTGVAADIYVSGMTVDKLAALAKECGFTGIGRYRQLAFVHVDLRQPAGEWEA